MPALSPPSRTATPTPIDALLAPLHLTPDDDTETAALAAVAAGYPTVLTPRAVQDAGLRSLETTSLFDLVDSPATATTTTTTPTPRKRTVDFPVNSAAFGLSTTAAAAAAAAATATGSGWSSPTRRRQLAQDSESGRRDIKGKGRASPTKTSGGDRDVIVHKVLKTDSIASISVKYGITPQALRASNRLWPSDPLFLRSQLLIPLDQCTASAGAGAGRLTLGSESRSDGSHDDVEQGDLMRWDAESEAGGGGQQDSASAASHRASPGLRPKLGEPPPVNSSRLDGVAFDGLADSPATTPQPQSRESSEYLTVWDDSDGVKDGAVAAAAVAAALETTPKSSEGFGTGEPVHQAKWAAPQEVDPFTRQSERRPPRSSSTRSNPKSRSSSGLTDDFGDGARYRIERMPASELAFFPAPVASPPPSDSTSSRRVRTNGARYDDIDEGDDDSSSLFFRPLARQLQQLSIPLPSFLSPSSSSSSSANSNATGRHGSGRIRLPPSPLLSPSTSASSLSGLQALPDPSGSTGRPTHRRKDSSARSGPPVILNAGGSSSSKSKKGGGGGGWGLLDFGAEEDEANQVVQLRQLESHRSAGGERSFGWDGPGMLARRRSSNRTITAADFWNEPAANGAR